jgi:hypothetical protein
MRQFFYYIDFKKEMFIHDVCHFQKRISLYYLKKSKFQYSEFDDSIFF